MSLLAVAGTNSAVAGGYDIDNSLKFEADNTEYLEKTFSSDGNRKTYTTSMWIKRTEIGQASTLFGAQPTSGTSDETTAQFGITSDDKFQCGFQNFYVVQTNRVLRDTSAWYHIVVRIDTTQSTVGDRFKVWINGEEETSFSTDNRTSITQNQNTGINSTSPHRVGALIGNSWYFSGYMAEVHHVDGQALSPSDFAETDSDTGIWKPKAYTGSYGTNGFYLDFENSASLGADGSGNSNDFTLNNITSADQATDTPTNNFATLNPLFRFDECTIFAGATRVKKTTTNRWRTFVSSIGVTSGKWYAEFQNPLHATTGTDRFIGVAPATNFNQSIAATGGYLGGNSTETTDSIGYHGYTGNKFINGTGSSFGNTYAGETVAIALDMDNGYVYFAKANTWQNSGDPTSGATGTGGIALQLPNDTHYLACSIYDTNADFQGNFGGYTDFTIASAATDANGYGVFEFAPPSGYYALCSKNLAEFG